MTEIEQKALVLLNDVSPYECVNLADANHVTLIKSLRRAIEQHEAFKREVSDAVEDYVGYVPPDRPSHPITRFILPKPDPLVEVMQAWWDTDGYASIDTFRAALAKHGLKLERIEHE